MREDDPGGVRPPAPPGTTVGTPRPGEDPTTPRPRPTRQELDQAIVDCAALLFARHGYSHTSVQQIADAVGYSKTGLLHRFPSKQALRQAVADQFVAESGAVLAAAGQEPPGPSRDRLVIEALTDLALHRQGTTALMVSALTARETAADLAWMEGVADALFGAFGLHDRSDQERITRILGALGAVAVIALAVADERPEGVRDRIVATAYDALGHPGTAAGR